MQVSLLEFKTNVSKYLDLAEKQNIYIMNGKSVAKIAEAEVDKVAAMTSVFGAIPSDADLDKAKMERLS